MRSQLRFNLLFSKNLCVLYVSLLLTACINEENSPDSTALENGADKDIAIGVISDEAQSTGSASAPTQTPSSGLVPGVNSPATISGTYTGSITEDFDPDGDNLLEVSGKLNISDSDAGEAAFRAGVHNGIYGRLIINAGGNWSYAANNSHAAIQALPAGAVVYDPIRVNSIDGTSRNVIIMILGSNDASIINGVYTGSVTEDVDPDRDNLLEVSGKLNISDSDTGEAAFVARLRRGSYGSLSINASGNWNYTADNNQAPIQSLSAGARLFDLIEVNSIDGTPRYVFITIHGVNDATTISGVNTGSVTEDVDPDGDNLLEVSGKLNITGSDTGALAFRARTRNGTYGSLTINAAGNWNYSANNNQAAIQTLATGSNITDRIQVSSRDGTTRTVVITINGVDESDTTSDITLSWVAPTEREDGTAISMAEIAGYRVYYGTSEGDYPNQVVVADRTTMQATLRNLETGTYYIVVTTYDTDGRESAYSEVAVRSL